MSERICQAATVRGRGCRKKATAYHGQALLCPEHQRSAREGRLRLTPSTLAAVSSRAGEGGAFAP